MRPPSFTSMADGILNEYHGTIQCWVLTFSLTTCAFCFLYPIVNWSCWIYNEKMKQQKNHTKTCTMSSSSLSDSWSWSSSAMSLLLKSLSRPQPLSYNGIISLIVSWRNNINPLTHPSFSPLISSWSSLCARAACRLLAVCLLFNKYVCTMLHIGQPFS